MYKSLVTPGKYYQGKDIIENLFTYIEFIGNHFLILVDQVVIDLVQEKFKKSVVGTKGSFEFVLFNNESTEEEADRIVLIAREKNVDGIIGAGGGKVIDTAKLVSDKCNIPLVIVPTSAASDAPCSAASVIYDEEGTFLRSCRMKRNPDVVVVDTGIISKAPVRLLVSGMGDAYATYYEARACHQSKTKNYTGGLHTEAAYALAKECNNILLKYGASAKESVVNKEWSEDLEKVVEANIYLSGVGFENNGCAISHAIYNGMTAVIKPLPVMHGEGVAFGTIVQLVTEYLHNGEWNETEWNEVLHFYESVGLPVSLKDFGIEKPSDQLLMDIAKATCNSGPNAHKMPFEVTPQVIYESLLRVNKLFDCKQGGKNEQF